VSGLAVRIEPIRHEDRARFGIPMSETFAVSLSTGEVVGTNEDVPAGLTPEQFAESIAAVRGAEYVGASGLLFLYVAGCWSSFDPSADADDDSDVTARDNRGLAARQVIRVRTGRRVAA